MRFSFNSSSLVFAGALKFVRNMFLVAQPGVRGHRVPVFAVARLSQATCARGHVLVGQSHPRLGCLWPQCPLLAAGRLHGQSLVLRPLSRCCPATRLPHSSLHYCYRCPPCLALRCCCCPARHHERGLAPIADAVASPFMALRPHMPCPVMDAHVLSVAAVGVPH